MNALTTDHGRDASAGVVFGVQLMGQFRLIGPEGRPISIQGRRTRAVLATLLLAPGQSMGRERLAGLFWGDRGEAQARASLRQCLLELRGAFAAAGEDAAEASLVTSREAVGLAPGAFGCDVLQLRAALAGTDWERAAQAVEAAGAAPLLQDLELGGAYGEWLDVSRAEIDARIADGIARLIAARESEQDWPAVKALAAAGLRRDPLNEPVVAALIRAEIASGAPAAAHIRYQAFRASLAAEIGVAPGPLVEAALRSEAPAEPFVLAAPPLPAAAAVAAQPAASPSGELLLAVLAFDNLTGDPDFADFCDGVSEEIQRTVARGTGIAVVARASSFQLRGPDKDTDRVCAALGATHVLDGSVRRSGSRVRISAELVECTSRRVLWSERFDGDLADVFALQDSIAEEVAQALKLTLAARTPLPQLEPATYEKFLRARGLIASGDPQYDNTAPEALPLLEAVTRDAPGHAPAWELLAIARAWVLRSGRSDQPYAEGRDGVMTAAETALRLDPARSGAYVALAMLEPWGEYGAREKLLKQALEIDPRDPMALTDMSAFCWSVGRFRDALRCAEEACALNPLLPSARLLVAQMLMYVGEDEASIRMHVELLERWPDNPGILYSLINSAPRAGAWDVYDAVIGRIDRFEGLMARDMHATKTYGDTMRHMDPQQIEQRVARYSKLLDSTGTLPLNLALSIAWLDRVDLALDLIERASYDYIFEPDGGKSSHFSGTILARWSPFIASPRFVPLVRRLGLSAYWVETGNWPDLVSWAPYDFKAQVRRSMAG